MGRRVAAVSTLVLVCLMMASPEAAAVGVEPPSGFTGRMDTVEGEDDPGCWGTYEIVGGVEQHRGYRCEGWVRTGDPSFTGSDVEARERDVRRDTAGVLADGDFVVSTVTRRVENDDCAWVTAPSLEAWWVSPREGEQTERTGGSETVVFSGQGDYEGLTAVVWVNPYVLGSRIWSVIFHGEPPPAPSEAW